MEKIRIKLQAYDHRILDESIKKILDAIKRTNVKISGPIPLPTKISRYTILRSTNVDKKSREQFEIRVHKRLLDIHEPNIDTISALLHLNLPSAVNIEIKTL